MFPGVTARSVKTVVNWRWIYLAVHAALFLTFSAMFFDVYGTSSVLLEPHLFRASCVEVALRNSTYVRAVQHCQSRQFCGLGYFSIQLRQALPNSAFHIRLHGPESAVLKVDRHSDYNLIAEHRLRFAGLYTTQILLLFVNYNTSTGKDRLNSTPSDHSELVDLMLNNTRPDKLPVAMDYTFDLSCNVSVGSGQSNAPQCPFDFSKTLGRWRAAENTPLKGYLNRSRLMQNSWPKHSHPAIHLGGGKGSHEIQYTHDTCKLHDFGRDTLVLDKCLADKRVCLWGDSHLRHLSNSMISIRANRTDFPPRNALQHPNIIYSVNHFGDFVASAQTWTNPHNCSSIIFNFGVWPASRFAKPPFWSVELYRQRLEVAMQSLVDIQNKMGLQIIWATSNPHGINHLPLIRQYNAISRALAVSLHIPMLETFDIIEPLLDLSYDGGHYKGVVGWTLGNHAFNMVCHGYVLAYAHQGRRAPLAPSIN